MAARDLASENKDHSDAHISGKENDTADDERAPITKSCRMTKEQTYCLRLFKECPQESFFVHGYAGSGKSYLMKTYREEFTDESKSLFRKICRWVKSIAAEGTHKDQDNDQDQDEQNTAKTSSSSSSPIRLHDFPEPVRHRLSSIPLPHLRWWGSFHGHPLFRNIVQWGVAYHCVPLELQMVCPSGSAANTASGKTIHSFFRINYKFKDPLWTTTSYDKQRRHFCRLYKRFLYMAKRVCSRTQAGEEPTQQAQHELETAIEELYRLQRKNPVLLQLRSLHTLMIDEFSMVPPHLFLQMHHSLCTARDDHRSDRLPGLVQEENDISRRGQRLQRNEQAGEHGDLSCYLCLAERDEDFLTEDDEIRVCDTSSASDKSYHGDDQEQTLPPNTATDTELARDHYPNANGVYQQEPRKRHKKKFTREATSGTTSSLENTTESTSEDTCDDPVPPYADGPFGTVRLIIVGDLCQLPAIVPSHGSKEDECIRTYIYTTCTEHRNNINWLAASSGWKQMELIPPRRDRENRPYTPRYTFYTNLYRYMFHPHRNILQMNSPIRQANDLEFFEQLKKIRLGIMDDDVRKFIKSLEHTTFSPSSDGEGNDTRQKKFIPLYVFPTRKDADQMNRQYLDAIIQHQREYIRTFHRREWVERFLPKDVYQGYAGITYALVTSPDGASSTSRKRPRMKQSNSKYTPQKIRYVQHQVHMFEHSSMFNCVPNYAHMSPMRMREIRRTHEEPGNWYTSPWLLVPHPRVRPQTSEADDIYQRMLVDVRRTSTHEKSLQLVETLPVLLTRNLLDAEYGLVNGSRGVIIGFARLSFSFENGPRINIESRSDKRLFTHPEFYQMIASQYIRLQMKRLSVLDGTQGPTYEIPLVHFPQMKPPESIQKLHAHPFDSFIDRQRASSSASSSAVLCTEDGEDDKDRRSESEPHTQPEKKQRRGYEDSHIHASREEKDAEPVSTEREEFFKRVVPLLPVADRVERQEPPWRAVSVQIPLLPAAALTVHRLQSLTLDAGELYFGEQHWGNNKSWSFRYGQIYVALSRFRERNVRMAAYSDNSFVQDPNVLKYIRQFVSLNVLQQYRLENGYPV